MRQLIMALVALGSLLLFNSRDSFSQDKSSFQYIGAGKCKMCHNSTKKGAQFKVWSGTAHARAYDALGTPEAKKIAKEKGITDPQKSEKCLKCHVTGAGQPAAMFASSFNPEKEGIGCETCHGPGSKYKGMKVMKDLYAGKIKPESVGFKKPKPEFCTTCHNPESPTYKEFNYDAFWKKIAHPMPEK